MISIGKWVPTLLNLILKHNVNNDRKFHRDIKDANTFSQELRKLLKTKYYLSCTLNSTMALKEWVLRILKRQVHHNESFFSRCWRIDSLFWICWAAGLCEYWKSTHGFRMCPKSAASILKLYRSPAAGLLPSPKVWV